MNKEINNLADINSKKKKKKHNKQSIAIHLGVRINVILLIPEADLFVKEDNNYHDCDQSKTFF
ncbi:hypothetical protein [Flavobacterium sp. 9]|uniref:hypothetical protein n=1 Tax=Flavobacterium sp. 9 TaxID=2035198 RepID=UPI000C19183C|nr:hypothetical protein [Flavobacterium sp. 9]